MNNKTSHVPQLNFPACFCITGAANSPKPRGITKSNTMTGNRPIPVGGSVGRRSTIGYEAKASSNEKTNTVGEPAPRYAFSPLSPPKNNHIHAILTKVTGCIFPATKKTTVTTAVVTTI